jgi:hypothetical protein
MRFHKGYCNRDGTNMIQRQLIDGAFGHHKYRIISNYAKEEEKLIQFE